MEYIMRTVNIVVVPCVSLKHRYLFYAPQFVVKYFNCSSKHSEAQTPPEACVSGADV